MFEMTALNLMTIPCDFCSVISIFEGTFGGVFNAVLIW